jgi:aminomuconate-semialdehyde/2-hydroxymuconate-6-semialdehyde dehydrogenase
MSVINIIETMNILNYINGELIGGQEDEWLDNFNPATGEKYGRIPDSSKEDVELAWKAAHDAFPAWSALKQEERSRYLLRIAELIEVHQEKLALAESADNGKPLSLARRMDIPRASDNFRFYATAALHMHSETYDMGEQGFNYVLNRPIGVAGLISPWNLPLYLFTWKVAPALAVGNTVVAKPSEVTPATAFILSQICIEAGLPPGVFNIVHGTGPKAGQAIVAHPKIPVISFTGGTSTGAAIAKIAAPMFKKLSLELGGKNPNIIFEDCDYDQMLKTTLASSFTNQGQICLCGSRILVQRGLYEKFLKDFTEGTRAMKVGDPLEADTRVGAIVSRAQYEKVLHYILLAKEEGGKIETGGKPVYEVNERCKNGWFLEPTIVTGLDEHCRVNQEEIFGPVVSIIPFDTEEDALRMANATQYGLSATLWTSNLKRAHRMAAKIESGIIWVNCWLVRDLRTPFGGMKNSGVGREGGFEALKFFTETRNICIQL